MLRTLIYALAACAGYAALRLGAPLPWMIGSMVVSAAFTLALNLAPPPRFTRATGQLIVGSAIGLQLTTDAVTRVVHAIVPIVASALIFIVWGCLVGLVQAKLAGTSRATAIFSCVPGGPVEMANLAASHGGNAAQTALAQTLRIVAIVFLFPPLVILSGDRIGYAAPPSGDLHLQGVLWLLGLSAAAGFAARHINLMNPFFIGPTILIGVLTAATLPMPGLPSSLVAAAQILLGVSLGGIIQRDLFATAPSLLLWIVVTTVLLLVVTFALGALWAALFGHDIWTMLLANAPGGATEMALTAQAVRLDISLVVGFQICRIMIVMLLLPLVYRAINRW